MGTVVGLKSKCSDIQERHRSQSMAALGPEKGSEELKNARYKKVGYILDIII